MLAVVASCPDEWDMRLPIKDNRTKRRVFSALILWNFSAGGASPVA
jgi:hypothetical protein